MLLTEYDETKTIRLFRKEAKEEGRKEGLKEGQRDLIKVMMQKGISAEQISEMTNLPRQEVEEIRAGVEKSAKRKSETPQTFAE